jgi:hypothetical protein
VYAFSSLFRKFKIKTKSSFVRVKDPAVARIHPIYVLTVRLGIWNADM